ncbi:hypothetical protein [Nonomuraea sp. NPDC046570]|uniref:hypothetical protein n=1 Tax=Nonomuraea sp. NPDC046570 TaxID=3155255 RepID=UPI00340DBC03
MRDLLAEEGAKHSFRFQRIALKLYGGKPATPQHLPPELVVLTPHGRPVASISIGRAAMWIVSYKHPGVGNATVVDKECVAPSDRPDHIVEFVLSLLGAAAETEVA